MVTPPRPAPGIARVAFTGTFGNAKWANVMHVRINPGSSLTQAIAQELANGMHNAYYSSFGPALALAWSLLETSVVVYDAGGQVWEAVTASPAAGQDSGVPLSANVALCVSWKTNAYYRGGKPRTYLCGLVQDRLGDQTSWSAQTIADFDAAALAFKNAVNNLGLAGSHNVTFGYLQLFANQGSLQKPPDYLDPPIFHVINSQVVHPRVDSQRRRLGREVTS